MKSDKYEEFEVDDETGPIDSVRGTGRGVTPGSDLEIRLKINQPLGKNVIFRIVANGHFSVYVKEKKPRNRYLTSAIGFGISYGGLLGRFTEGFEPAHGTKISEFKAKTSVGGQLDMGFFMPISRKLGFEIEPVIQFIDFEYGYQIDRDSVEKREVTFEHTLSLMRMAAKIRWTLVEDNNSGAQLVLSPGVFSQNITRVSSKYSVNVNGQPALKGQPIENSAPIFGKQNFGTGATLSWARGSKRQKGALMKFEWHFSWHYWFNSIPRPGSKGLQYDNNLVQNTADFPGFKSVNVMVFTGGLRLLL